VILKFEAYSSIDETQKSLSISGAWEYKAYLSETGARAIQRPRVASCPLLFVDVRRVRHDEESMTSMVSDEIEIVSPCR
jgi:hypothetical protein